MAQDADVPEDPDERPDFWLPPSSGHPALEPADAPPARPAPEPPPPSREPSPTPPAYGPQHTPTRRRRWGLVWLAVPIALLILVAIAITSGSGSSSRSPSRPTSNPSARTADVVWSIEAGLLRPDLTDPEFVSSIDGSFQDIAPVEIAGMWLLISGRADAGDTVLHAIDPATGDQRWQRRLDGVLCATEAPKSGILCASVLRRDRVTGLGTRWRLHLIDPATGADRRSRDIEGWLTAVHQAGQSFVLLEQREPAPHAVVRAVATDDLRPLWTRDLSPESGHDEMFGRDRIILRPEPEHPGLALDRPRLRDVGPGLIAVWAGQRTAFLERDTGKLVMMPHCSRLVDDGVRLWCNETDGASAYSYAGKLLHRITGPRLAFPNDDGVGADRNRPVFLNDAGAAVAVDLATGAVGDAYTPPGRGSAFGMVTDPSAYTVGKRTFLIGETGTMLIDPNHDRMVWTNPEIKVSGQPVVVGDRVLLGNSTLALVDLQTGSSTGTIKTDTIATVAIGDRIAGTSPDRIRLIRAR